jgi:hypothetical protein
MFYFIARRLTSTWEGSAASSSRRRARSLNVACKRRFPSTEVEDEKTGVTYEERGHTGVEKFLLKHSRKPYRAEDLGKVFSRRFEQNHNSQDSEDIVQMLKGWELLSKEPDSLCEVLNVEQTPDEAPETVIPPDREAAQADPSSEHGGLTRQLAGRHFFCKPGIFERYGSPQRYR